MPTSSGNKRSFASQLTSKGSAQQIRDQASLAVKEVSLLAKSDPIEPVDYETYIVKNKSSIHNDPQRELLMFPYEELTDELLVRELRTEHPSVPDKAEKEVSHLLARECIKSYTSNYSLIHNKYEQYSGSYLHLPAISKKELDEQTFEGDIEDRDEDSTHSKSLSDVAKQGWLLKGPDSSHESSSFLSKSFKKRYVYLKKQRDSTYKLDICKDDKKAENKGQVFLDSAVEILPSKNSGSKFAFVIRMQDGASYLFAAETEGDMNDWMKVIKQVISSDNISQRSTRTEEDAVSMNGSEAGADNYKPSGDYHDITRYMREIDSSLARDRKQKRCALFDVYRDLPHQLPAKEREAVVSMFKETFPNRFTLLLQEFRLKLQANVFEDSGGERYDNPEPFFLTIALYDGQEGRKLTENVYLDCNSDTVYKMIPEELLSARDGSSSQESAPKLRVNNEKWLSKPSKLLFSVNSLSPNIYVVVLVEKVLQGGVSSAVDPYLKGHDPKTGSKVHQAMKQYCKTIGHYRMPFAWAARPLCRSNRQIDLTAGTLALYRQESTRLSEDDIIKHLQDLSRPDKVSKLVAIPGNLQLVLDLLDSKDKIEGILTPSLDVVKPYPLKMDRLPVLEVEQFTAGMPETAEPYSVYRNHLYVYPKSVKCDNIKNVKARNIAVCVELRDSDDEGATALKCIYGKPRGSVFTAVSGCAVIHHVTSPEFYEEIKICLPPELTERHHILVTFYHVSCEASVKASRQSRVEKGCSVDTLIGYSWIPLMRQKRICDGDHVLPMASLLPPGYLSHEHPGINKVTGPDVKWHDGGKGIFKIKLRLQSTIYTNDQHLHNFFSHCQKVQNTPNLPNEMEAKNMLKAAINGHGLHEPELRNSIKALHAANITTVISFLPTLLNQLFKLLPSTSNDEIAFESVRVIAHVVHEICELNKDHLLRSYVKYTFNTMELCSHKVKSVHEELVKQLSSLLRPLNSDFLVVGKFLRYSWFFFELISKSISQYLIATKRIKMARAERFAVTKETTFMQKLETFIRMTISHIFSKYKEHPQDTRNANMALSQFIKRCFTLLDRGFVFKLINLYMENFGVGDPKLLQEYKFEFISVVCSHEHYVQLSLPTLRSGYARSKASTRRIPIMEDGILSAFAFVQDDAKVDYTLTNDYRKKHFLSGLLLQEVKSALNEIVDVRKVAIRTLRNQLAKHAMDNRYQKENYLGRIVTLYLPLFSIILENKNRLMPKESSSHALLSNRNSMMLTDQSDTVSLSELSLSKANSLPYGSRLSTVVSPTEMSVPSAKDSLIYSVIAGNNTGMLHMKSMRGGDNGLAGSRSSLCSNESTSTIDAKDSVSLSGGLTRGSTVAAHSQKMRYDKLDSVEVKDLLISFLFVVKNMPEDVLIQWMTNTSENDLSDLFDVFEICLKQFKYIGKKALTSIRFRSVSKLERFFGLDDSMSLGSSDALATSYNSSSRKVSSSVPSRRGDSGKHFRQSSGGFNSDMDEFLKNPENYSTVLMEGNLVAEVGTAILDVLALYTQHFKTHLMYRDGDNIMMRSVFDLHMLFLKINQSEQTLKHCFGLIRMFIIKFPQVLFKGKATFCGQLCYELLRCCNSRLYTIRMEACITIYFLMRANFEHSKRLNFARVRLQMMVAVSTLINDIEGVTGSRFQESLGVINNYAKKDKLLARTKLPEEISTLTRRIRTVLMATEKMKEHHNDPEKLVDLQYSLAKQYVSSPELRTTWLRNMARKHHDRGDYSEAAHCYLHYAGAVAEFLKQMADKNTGTMSHGCKILHDLSANVVTDETNTIDDRAVIEELQYTEDTLIETLEKAAEYLTKAERFEALGSLYRIVIPLYEKKRDLESLADCYKKLHEAYSQAVEVTRSCKRMLGSYFRVAFFGQVFEDEDGKEYIYKEPKVTQLSEICHRLKTLHGEKFGSSIVSILQDSRKVDKHDLDPHMAYIQVTYVTPYFTEKELQERKTDFERNSNVKRFVYHTPFTKSGKAHGEITHQWMKKTVLTTEKSFPYVKKRIAVANRTEVDISPIEVAIEEMTNKVTALNNEVYTPQPDIKKLQLKLQGAVSAQVNAGPMAYAEAFLSPGAISKLKLSSKHVDALKQVFREFATVCNAALELNKRLIDGEQSQYHESLVENFRIIKEKLQEILSERELIHSPQLLTEVMNALHLDQRSSLQLSHTTSSSSA